MKKTLHIVGHAACFIVIFAMLGGHWLALQSVAWTRMLVAFSEQDSFSCAILKTFDGNHPCAMCLQIREGRQQEENHKSAPLISQEKMPDMIMHVRQALFPLPLIVAYNVAPTVPLFCPDFIESPPTPPPRPFAVAS